MKNTTEQNNFNGLISIIIPLYNEEDNIMIMADTIQDALSGYEFEILFVDDGSTDKTRLILRQLSAANKHIRYISFSRNFGHQNALKAGFDYCRGACAITMDGDLQHPPSLLRELLQKWHDGAAVVHTRRARDKNTGLFKKTSSSLYYRLFSLCATVNIEPGTADFRLLDRKLIELCKSCGDDSFFWRGFIPWLGFRQEYINYTPSKRLHGRSKYSLKKMLRLAWAGISSFSMLPLRLSWLLGGGGLLFGFLYFIYILWQNFMGNTLPGWSSLMVALLFFGSVQLLMLGVLGEYIGKIYLSGKRRPHYIIDEAKSETEPPSITEAQ
ncbi:glycosyltransferase family 2 protein [Desulfovibrio sp. OttesenSCG-928-G11]|nr:glycosyltransferase family 2 protein [Desulfovibrio sp. OttesenSCG-928-G11]